MSKKIHLNTDHIHTLTHASQMAVERFRESREEMLKVVEAGGIDGFMTVAAAKHLAKQFERQIKDQEVMQHVLAQADSLLVEVEPCEDCEEDICLCDIEDEEREHFRL